MQLGLLAWALGVNEKTADNAIRTLGLSRPVEVETARALGLALRLKHRHGVPLKRAYPVLHEALVRPGARAKDPLVRAALTYLPTLDADIEQATRSYHPLPRGPGWRDPYHAPVPARLRRHPAVRRAIRWGLDLDLNLATLEESAGERVRSLSRELEGLSLLAPVVEVDVDRDV